MNKYLTLFCLIFIATAQGDEALLNTQTILADPAKRAEYLKANPDAKNADEALKAVLPDTASQEAAYGLSQEVLQNLAIKTGGDPEKMQKLLMEILANPSLLKGYLRNPDKIKELGEKVQNPETQGKTQAPRLKK